jgi:hypothetical protein
MPSPDLQTMLSAALDRPTDTGVDNGYQWDSTSDPWKQLCSALPCFGGLAWPLYDTKVIETTLFGQPIVIQLWKGLCPQFLGKTTYPGGVGGEVGIYQRVPGRKLPDDLGFLPLPLRLAYAPMAALAGDKFWWPVPATLQPKISLVFINPTTNTALFDHAYSDQTYWLTKWMEFGSYKQYAAANQTPLLETGFKLVATIDDGTGGKTYEW